MSQYFDKLIDTVVQSTGANTGSLTTTADRASFQTNVKADIARLVQQYNNVVYPAISVLRSGPLKTMYLSMVLRDELSRLLEMRQRMRQSVIGTRL